MKKKPDQNEEDNKRNFLNPASEKLAELMIELRRGKLEEIEVDKYLAESGLTA